MGNNSLWNYTFEKELATPKVILERQAQFLNEEMNNLLQGEVLAYPENKILTFTEWKDNQDGKKNRFVVKFKIVAPTLNKFSFTLLEVYHNIIDIYPCEVHFPLINMTYENVEANLFEDVLKTIFNHEKTKHVFTNILSMVN